MSGELDPDFNSMISISSACDLLDEDDPGSGLGQVEIAKYYNSMRWYSTEHLLGSGKATILTLTLKSMIASSSTPSGG